MSLIGRNQEVSLPDQHARVVGKARRDRVLALGDVAEQERGRVRHGERAALRRERRVALEPGGVHHEERTIPEKGGVGRKRGRGGQRTVHREGAPARDQGAAACARKGPSGRALRSPAQAGSVEHAERPVRGGVAEHEKGVTPRREPSVRRRWLRKLTTPCEASSNVSLPRHAGSRKRPAPPSEVEATCSLPAAYPRRPLRCAGPRPRRGCRSSACR